MPADFTSPDVFAGYLSSFWTQVFAGSEAVRGMVDGQSTQLNQLSTDFGALVRSASVATARPLRDEEILPIFLRRSQMGVGPDVLAFGQGANYGPQDADSPLPQGATPVYGQSQRRETPFYHVLPAGVVDPGQTLLSGLYEPGVVWVAGADFAFDPATRILSFVTDPFADPRFARRTVASVDADGGDPDEQIVMFGLRARIQAGDLQRRWGYPFLPHAPTTLSADQYRQLLTTIVTLFSGGATVAALDSFFAATAGLPVTREPIEAVVAVTTFGGQNVVITDAHVYPFGADQNPRPGVVPGATLRAGSPLSDGTRVFDRHALPDWWVTEPGLTVGTDFLGPALVAGDIRSLGFPNVESTVDPNGGRGGRFPVVGRPADVDAFWSYATLQAGSQPALADLLWRGAGIVDDAGAADFTRPLPVNPWGWLFNNLVGDGLIGVELKLVPTDALLLCLNLLRDVLPVGSSLAIFLSPGFTDDLPLSVDPATGTVDPAVSPPGDLRLRLAGAPLTNSAMQDAALPVAAAAGPDTTGGLLSDTIDFSDPSLLQHSVRPVNFPRCN